MTIEIRPIEPAEAHAYLKVLPYVNGLPHWEPAPAAWHGGPEAWPPPNAPASAAQLDAWAERVLGEGFHPQAAFVDGRLVGGSAMLAMDVTVPGPRPVALGGVTATAVSATHRRRGLLRGLMQAMFDEARARGEAVAGLSASEGGIYGRYGFAPATRRTRWELDRAEAAFADADPPAGELELADAATARTVWPAVHARVRRERVGELSPQPGRWDGLTDEPAGTFGPMRYLVHRDGSGAADGIAQYRLPYATRVEDTGTLVVEALEAATPDAYRALWALLTDFDLTRRIVAPARPADEPLRWMLRNPRAMRVTRQSDSLWLRILDLPRAVPARAYEAAATLVVEVEADPMAPPNAGTWRLELSPDGASCTRTTAAPDLTLSIQSLGALYLGGMSAALLAAAGRVREHRAGAVAALGRALRTDPEPFNAFAF
ncbi:GNAT family N-acetyltransferase [Dactylosporangium sp. NPDC049140]|uniref:GNAT family N-acetyltransferase n=1 Tax=Dactylosporangium sp. NPDC049140 TaxID=3155647 RepID=UPI0033DFDC1B